ncbi:alpha/beta hydrolase [Halorarum halobium]|uniref:alpha/beta hydrolase n=1 Tax=Halorarum halobium TaxID=3075121 RepID=UPI0028B159CE|nr:alpha/beta hydrolase [Halobaculum sp. XH14]
MAGDRLEREPSRESFATRRVAFDSDGDSCTGTLYLPAEGTDPPLVVMANGLAAEANFGLPRYAERFAAAGIAAFTFDYRGFDGSAGEPLVLPDGQLEDWRAALDRAAAGFRGVGDARALWGTGLSGGYVLTLAAERSDVDAVVTQVPLLDGRKLLRAKSPRYVLRALASGLRDRLGGRFGRTHEVKVYGDPDEFALLNEPGAKDAYVRLIPRESRWRNRTRARTLLALPRYRPIAVAADVTAPTLVIAGTEDELHPYGAVESLVETLPDATLVSKRMGHFDASHGAFPELFDHQLAFLRATFDEGERAR